MIISHKHRYVFLELPFTATRAISRELQLHYDGIPILSKHSNYPDFARYANAIEKNYFIFCGLRNPMQIPVSLYLKYRNTNIEDLWLGDPEKKHNRNPVTLVHDAISRPKVRFAQRNDVGFDDFFLKYFKLPYDDWSRVSLKYCSAIIRFESLQKDFANTLAEIGLKQMRELPKRGNAVAWSHDPAGYYGDRAKARAKWVFGPYMKRWGYRFPEDWDDVGNQALANLTDDVLSFGRFSYWRWIRGILDLDVRARAKLWPHATN